ncbi:MAG: hypothetical protein MI725_11995 [Pirellulales bacterium]|nr:hypothetical protein [Pirellulales bacterium]
MEARTACFLPFRLAIIVMRRCRGIYWWLISTAVGGLWVAPLIQAPAWAELSVRTTDGRQLVGEVDSRTSDQALWVRQESEQIILATALIWSEIASIEVDGESIEQAQWAQRAGELASTAREGFLLEYPPPQARHGRFDHRRPAGHVTSLEIDAVLVNLDRDVEPDGYELAIAAIDEFGKEVPVKGNLYVRLMVERNVHHTGRIRFEDIQQWNQPVAPHDFADGVARYVLPFRGFAPEFDDELRPDAQLNVRLGVIGEGNFAATIPVPLWQFSPFRDRLQKFEGSRFFRDELTHRVRHLNTDPPGIYRRVWNPR